MSSTGQRGDRQPRLFLKITPSNFDKASRDKRELGVARDLGMDTLVLTRGDGPGRAVVDGWECVEVSTRPLGDHRSLTRLNRLVSLATWAWQARRLQPSIISGHDLVGTLIAWLSTLFLPISRRPALIYDSNEFELGRHTGRPRNAVVIRMIRYLESFLMRRCAFSIMVNGAIADRVQEIHGLKDRPVVIRSTPSLWTVDEDRCAEQREEFCRILGMPRDTFLLMYHGAVIPNRGIEVSIRALVGRQAVALVVLGDGRNDYLARLRHLAVELGVGGRVLFHEAVPLEHLGTLVGAADVGMVTVPAVSESYYMMLPNKFFENVQSLTPVIASDFPEIGSLVRKYDIGVLVDPEDVAQVGAAVDRLSLDADLRRQLRENLLRAKTDLCWEKERDILVAAYETVVD